MSSTEVDRARELAAQLFDTVIVPLAESRRAAGQQAFFALQGSTEATTFFHEPMRRKMSAADFEFPGGGSADGLADALGAAWAAEGQTELASMRPTLKAIGEAMADRPSEGDDTISPLIYTMF